jgi:hypothetical protein
MGRSMNAPYVHVFTLVEGKLKIFTDHQDTAIRAETLASLPAI